MVALHIDILTLFPDSIRAVMGESILGRAQKNDIIRIQPHQIRDYTKNRQMQVDDYPYGGGQGMLMQVQPLYDCWADVCREAGERLHTIFLSAAGKRFTQADAIRLKNDYDRFILVCGHYEGVDERFLEECVDEEISVGDFVLTGGELPAMTVADAVCRLVPGSWPTRAAFRTRATTAGFWNTPSIPGRSTGTRCTCRRCCSPGTTPPSPAGGGRRPCGGRCCAGRTCWRAFPRTRRTLSFWRRSAPSWRRERRSSPKPVFCLTGKNDQAILWSKEL